MTEPITVNEREDLARLEGVIEEGVRSWVHSMLALKEIHDRRLYRETHVLFKEYVAERWGIEKTKAFRQMRAAESVIKFSLPDTTPESTLNDIFRLRNDAPKVVEESIKRAGGRKLSQKIVREVALELIGENNLTINPVRVIAKPAKRETNWSWPAWLKAKFIAMDRDGNWSAFSERPTRNKSTGSWQCDGGETWLFSSLIKWTPPKCSDWEQSLMERPVTVEVAA